MPIKRIVREVTLYFLMPPTGAPDEYYCDKNPPAVYVLDVGNQPGTAVFDVRAELAPFQPPPVNIWLAAVDVVDDTHVSITCIYNDDTTAERAKYRLIILVDA